MKEFIKIIKKQKALSIVQLFSLIVCIMSIAIAFILLIYKKYQYLMFCLITFTIFLAIIYFIKKLIFEKDMKYYEFELDNIVSYSDLKNIIEKDNVKSYSNSDNCIAYSFGTKEKYRVVLYQTVEFNKKEYYSARKSANKGINKKCNIKNNGSISEISSKRKINIAFVDNMNDKLQDTLNIPAEQYINMSSSLLNVVVVKNKLCIPCFIGFDFWSIFEYDELVKKVFSLFNLL
jgi:hypothetical protein